MVEIVLQILIEFLGELLLMFGVESVVAPFQPAKATNRILAFSGLFILAVASSLIFSLFAPNRLLPQFRVAGVSLLISPILVGSVMHIFGQWRTERGKPITHLATFWGGAYYSFFFALTRVIFLYFNTPIA
ncbi:hypothetical protein [Geothrix sp. PMB-07]|uniref:hypothetical protein n=1 Tax=Geothrix sp. PMB-07 TaxID=3068640 RepID=UPI0027408DFF|nr:hypothetical protein [Geothrix sp. PMB-07]WLT30418.1 hypothetical protein Q9293_11880 [Geothrix sp. PMB-07]